MKILVFAVSALLLSTLSGCATSQLANNNLPLLLKIKEQSQIGLIYDCEVIDKSKIKNLHDVAWQLGVSKNCSQLRKNIFNTIIDEIDNR